MPFDNEQLESVKVAFTIFSDAYRPKSYTIGTTDRKNDVIIIDQDFFIRIIPDVTKVPRIGGHRMLDGYVVEATKYFLGDQETPPDQEVYTIHDVLPTFGDALSFAVRAWAEQMSDQVLLAHGEAKLDQLNQEEM